MKLTLFENQYNEYIRIKKLLDEIKDLKKKKDVKVEMVPGDINKKYEEKCQSFCIENNLYYETQEEIQEYLSNKKNTRMKLLYEAIY